MELTARDLCPRLFDSGDVFLGQRLVVLGRLEEGAEEAVIAQVGQPPRGLFEQRVRQLVDQVVHQVARGGSRHGSLRRPTAGTISLQCAAPGTSGASRPVVGYYR